MIYDERLSAPLRWWVQGTLLVASLWLALIVAIPPTAAWLISGLALAAMAALLIGYGNARIQIGDGEFRAGRAHIALEYVGVVTPLDSDATRHLAGPGADARAWLLLRPYRKRAVRVDLTDPADPTPYWLVSTRHPERLADALVRALGGTGPGAR